MNIDFDLYTFELKNILEDLVTREFSKCKKTYKGYNFRCPICGDSNEMYKTGRGHLFLNKTPYVYKCFNGGCPAENGMSATIFLREYYPAEYSEYIKMVIKATKESEEEKDKRKEQIRKSRYNVERKLPVISTINKLDISNISDFIKKNKNELVHMKPLIDYPEAIEFCEKRHIDRDIYRKWLYVNNNKDKKCFTKNRIIIPFINHNKQIYFYQARSIIGEEPKYKNSISDLRPIFNYYKADFSKPVMILEGPIDSLFVENSVATLGVKYNEELILSIPKKNRYFIFDNDSAGVNAAKKHLENGENVFMWKKFINNFYDVHGKIDFNDLSIQKNKKIWSFSELNHFFTNNILMKGLL
jgi:hypothetical protein